MQEDLSFDNSSNVVFNAGTNTLQLAPSSAGIVDTDGDDVPDSADACPGPGWRLPCDGDASDDGLYQTTYYGSAGEYTLGADVNVDGKISAADVYILMDATGSMVGEQKQLITDLINGTFINTRRVCQHAADTGLVGALSCVIEDVRMGLGQFNEVPLAPHGHPLPVHSVPPPSRYHEQPSAPARRGVGVDGRRSTWTIQSRSRMAIYAIATGQGLGPVGPEPEGLSRMDTWGYPCFRADRASGDHALHRRRDVQRSSRAESPTYGDPPFDGTVGLADFRLPPVEHGPGDDLLDRHPGTAHNLGDLSTKSVTVKGTNVNFGNDFTTWEHPRTMQGTAAVPRPSCWGDGYDGVVTVLRR